MIAALIIGVMLIGIALGAIMYTALEVKETGDYSASSIKTLVIMLISIVLVVAGVVILTLCI